MVKWMSEKKPKDGDPQKPKDDGKAKELVIDVNAIVDPKQLEALIGRVKEKELEVKKLQ